MFKLTHNTSLESLFKPHLIILCKKKPRTKVQVDAFLYTEKKCPDLGKKWPVCASMSQILI